MRYAKRTGTIAIAAAAVVVIGAFGIGSSAARPARAHAASAKPFKAKLSYVETNHGHAKGSATAGIQGHGSFSAKLSGHAALEVAIMSLATGVPLSKIAQGGSYKVQRTISAKGDVSGIAVVKLKGHGLGTLCVSVSAHPGKFAPGDQFVPTSGTLQTVGGTGAAARWRGKLSWKFSSVAGSSTEQFGVGGSTSASTGKAKGMSKACKQVAKLHG